MLRSQPGTSFFEGAKSSGWFLRHDNGPEFSAAINLNRMLPSCKKMSGTKRSFEICVEMFARLRCCALSLAH